MGLPLLHASSQRIKILTVIKEVNKQMQAVLREEGSCRSGENILSMMMLAVLLLGNTPVSIEFLRDSHFERKCFVGCKFHHLAARLKLNPSKMYMYPSEN